MPKSRRSVEFSQPLTLLVDNNTEAAVLLAAQLAHAGFPTRIAATCSTALDLVTTEQFWFIIVVSTLEDAVCLDGLRKLSRRAPRAWLIVISASDNPSAIHLVHKCGGDALITAPFAVAELAGRLAALSVRRRPV